MSKFLTKKNVLKVSFGYVHLVALIILAAAICDQQHLCEVREDEFPGTLIFLFLPLLPVFIFSLMTYRMNPKVFERWVNFSVWAVPSLIIITFLVNGGGNNGLGVEGVIGGAFDAFLIGIFYVLYCVISLWLIFFKHKK